MPTIPDSDAMNIVLVHGAWADGSGWEGVYRSLRKEKFSVKPSTGWSPLTYLRR